MPTTQYQTVPDWFSSENQGCGVAAPTVGGNPALVVFTVDARPGLNRGAYRVGRGLNPDGTISNGWTDWADVPDWESWENQGGGITTADITGSRQADLLVLRVDAPDGANAGWYRMGRDLNADGTIGGGWTPWLAIPDWFSWNNQGAGIATADLTGNGRPDLVVFMIDIGDGQNRGLYRVGRDLDTNGIVTDGWTPWLDVPDWFSWENQGGGVALADITGNGDHALIVLGIDNPPGPVGAPSADPSGQNQAYYRVGLGLNGDGIPTDGWAPIQGINNWTNWDNQYGALAVLGTGPASRLVVAAVDNPPGVNTCNYTVLPLVETPPVHGKWQVLPFNSEVLAIHAALLHTGKVLFFSGTGNNTVRDADPDFGDVSKDLWASVLWNPAAPAGSNFSHPATIHRDNGRPFDFFCGGDTFLPDGRLFSAGGNLAYNDGNNLGQRETAAFDPTTEQWTRCASMPVGRWYPTLITLADGRLFAVSGKNDTNGDLNRLLEVYDGQTDTWLPPLPEPTQAFPGLPFYAHLFLMADGTVFFTGGRMDDGRPQQAGTLDLTTHPVAFQPVDSQVTPTLRNQSSSVLLPPAQDQQVMIIGGGPEDDRTSATGSTERINLAAGQTAYTLSMPLSLPRMHLNAVLLPDRTVFVSGGAINHEEAGVPPIARLQSEIYHPGNDKWEPGATATVIRMYHSVALLMPDATVITASGNPPPYGTQAPWSEQPNEELKIETYSPSYFFKGPRPVITAAPTNSTYATTIDISTNDAGTILWAEIVHPGSTTHAFDNAQRLVDLPIAAVVANTLTVSMPQSPTIAPPGWYMLFLVDNQRVPSHARWIHLDNA